MNFIIAQWVGIIVAVFSVIIVQFKDIKWILIGEVISNFLVAASFILLDSFSGAAVCIVGAVQSVISCLYNKKEKKFPVWLTLLFCIAYVMCSALTYQNGNDILSGAAAVLFALAIVQSSTFNYRVLMCLNSFLWVIYDLNTMAYTNTLTHGFLLISALIAIVRLDIPEIRKAKANKS